MFLVHLMLAPSWAADCRTATSAEQIGATLQDAQLAYATLDEDGFAEATARATSQLACVGEVVPAPTVASYHRVMGLDAFLGGDAEAAGAAFQAALSIEPAYALSGKIAPEGGKLSRLYEAAKERPDPSTQPVTAPAEARVWINGVPATTRPVEIPVVIQLIVSNKPQWTVWLPAGEALPADIGGAGAAAAAPKPAETTAPKRVVDSNRNGIPDDEEVAELSEEELLEQELEEEELEGDVDLARLDEPDGRERKSTTDRDQERADRATKESGGGSGGLWGAAIASGAVGGGLYGSAALFRTQFENDPSAAKFHMTNGSYYGSIGFGTLALGLAGAAIAGGGK